MFKRIILSLLIIPLSISCDRGCLELSYQFREGMVLPKNKEIHVFGAGNGIVRVEINGVKAKSRAKGGTWCVTLPAMESGGPYAMSVRANGAETVVPDVYVGTVLLLSGQSNIQFKLAESSTPREEWVGDSLIREFTMPRIEKGEPYCPEDGWVRCTDGNAAGFSAIGYLLASELRRRSNEAVGLINCYQGASVIEAWIPAELSAKPEYQLPDEQKYKDHFVSKYHDWNIHGVLYDLDIAPLAPYSMSAVVWYQGESNTGSGEYSVYPYLFSEMAASWRKVFEDGDLPFIVVGIADLKGRGEAWHKLQAAQASIPDLVPRCFFVKSADVCDSINIHPADKKALSHRIADTYEAISPVGINK